MKKYHPEFLLNGQGSSGTATDVAIDSTALSKKASETALGMFSHWWDMATIGNVDALLTLLEGGCHVDAVAGDGSTALHCAAQAGQLAVVDFLLTRGAQVDVKNARSYTPLYQAAVAGRSSCVLTLLRAGSAFGPAIPFEPKLYYSATGFVDYIVRTGDVQLVGAILEFEGPVFTVERASKSRAFAVAAAKIGQTLILQSLIRSDPGAFVPSPSKGRSYSRGSTPLQFAVSRGHLIAARMLLLPAGFSEGSKPMSSHGHRLIRMAAMQGHVEILEALLECDPKAVNQQNGNKDTPLHLASLRGRLGVVKYLLSCPDIDVGRQNNCQDTALHIAARYGHLSIIEAIVGHKSTDVTKRGHNGETPLMSAFWRYQLHAIRILSKGDVFILRPHERSLEAVSMTEVVQRLLDTKRLCYDGRGSDPALYSFWNRRHATRGDIKGVSLLHLAAGFGDVKLADLVLRHDEFHPSIFSHKTCYEGYRLQNPLEIARRKGHKEVEDLLIAYGADCPPNPQVPDSEAIDKPTNVPQTQNLASLGFEGPLPGEHGFEHDFDLDLEFDYDDNNMDSFMEDFTPGAFEGYQEAGQNSQL